ncbi:MAG: hypothetical protein U9R53_02395 [Chloroflexota bacterium]|nr:hypothetical protein [Chloroflexota bacterium]
MLDAFELAVEAFELISPMLFFSLMGGIFLFKHIYDLCKLNIDYFNGLLVIALYTSPIWVGYSTEEWIDAVKSLKVEVVKVTQTIETDDFVK